MKQSERFTGLGGGTRQLHQNMKIFFQDFIWWYQQQAPRYGRFQSIGHCIFNAMHFYRDGRYRYHTSGEPNEHGAEIGSTEAK